mgnify:CR=1 FL=1
MINLILLEALQELKVFATRVRQCENKYHDIFVTYHGICENVQMYNIVRGKNLRTVVIHSRLKELFIGWPKFSGMRSYPVPIGDPNVTDISAAAYFMEAENMYIGDYGKLRIELIDYLIEQLEANVDV